jgi:hypothetical protein
MPRCCRLRSGPPPPPLHHTCRPPPRLPIAAARGRLRVSSRRRCHHEHIITIAGVGRWLLDPLLRSRLLHPPSLSSNPPTDPTCPYASPRSGGCRR